MHRKIPIETLEECFVSVVNKGNTITDTYLDYVKKTDKPIAEKYFRPIFNDYLKKRGNELHRQQNKFAPQSEIKELIFSEMAIPITVGEVIVRDQQFFLKDNPKVQIISTQFGYAKIS